MTDSLPLWGLPLTKRESCSDFYSSCFYIELTFFT